MPLKVERLWQEWVIIDASFDVSIHLSRAFLYKGCWKKLFVCVWFLPNTATQKPGGALYKGHQKNVLYAHLLTQ